MTFNQCRQFFILNFGLTFFVKSPAILAVLLYLEVNTIIIKTISIQMSILEIFYFVKAGFAKTRDLTKTCYNIGGLVHQLYLL